MPSDPVQGSAAPPPCRICDGGGTWHRLGCPRGTTVERAAEKIERAILDRAPTWETAFNAGPGQVVSVKDAAMIAAQEVIRGLI